MKYVIVLWALACMLACSSRPTSLYSCVQKECYKLQDFNSMPECLNASSLLRRSDSYVAYICDTN